MEILGRSSRIHNVHIDVKLRVKFICIIGELRVGIQLLILLMGLCLFE
jgi:hypothetical protein